MADVIFGLLAILYIAFAAIDIYVFWRIFRSAWARPHIDALTATAVIVGAVTVGGILGGILGLNSIWRQVTGEAVLPTLVSLFVLVAALGVPSLGVVWLLGELRRWSKIGARALHVHARTTDRVPHLHRRATDILPPPTATLHPSAPPDERPPL